MNEQLYIWAAIPASAAAPVIQVGVRSLQLYTCEGCQLVPHHSEPRAFPARTIPIGFALVATGQFRAQVHDILSTHQIFVGAETGLVVHYTDGGYLLSIPPAGAMQAQAEAMRLRVQLASSAAVARSLEEQPPPMQRMTRLEKRLERLEVYLLALDERILPRKPEVLSVRADLQEMIRGLQGEMEAVRGQLAQARHEAEQMQLAAGASPR